MTTGTTGEFIRVQTALAGRYSLERELGRGGMGIVYLARDVALDRLVALKLLPPQLASDANLRQRFLNEARTAAKLSHPNIIPIFAVDEIGELVFFVMAFVDGETLGQRIRSRGAIPPSELARLLREVAWGLAYAHGQGVVHRDVKADNILIERGSGRALVADFGIARVTHTPGATGAGEILGTAEYMSPEQASGEPMDHRSDIYSLGVVAFYSLAGKLPFEAASAPAMLAKHITQPAPLVRDVCDGVPSKLAHAVDRCLAKNPDERFPKAEDLADTISAVLESRKELPPPVRLFIRRSRDLSQVAAGVGFFQVLLAIEGLGFALAGAPVEVPLYMLAAGAAMGIIPVIPAVEQTRTFLKAGYTRAELIPALKTELEREREERVFEHGRSMTVAERVTRAMWICSTTLTGASVWALSGRVTDRDFMMFLAGSGFALVGGVLHLVRYDRRTDLSGRVMSWFWKSRFGKLMFRLGGVALKRSAIAAPATHRPTELAIGLAVDALFEALPKATQKQLADLPAVVRGLEADAMNIRRRVDELNDAAAIDPDMLAARNDAKARMADAVTALEGIRLNLLRLTAGAGSIDSLTADLSVARDVSEEVRRLLEGHREVEEHLSKRAE
jgi:eukaryotic-like serine/threonine-protein kinase